MPPLRRNTPALAAILSELQSAGCALSHDMLEQRLNGTVSRATIYRVLSRLHEDARVHRVVTVDGVQFFALCADCAGEDHHHLHLHFRCLGCERVECLPQEVQTSLPEGYRIAGFNATVSGYCANCTAA